MKTHIRAQSVIAAFCLALCLLAACGSNTQYLHDTIEEKLHGGDVFTMSELLYFSGDSLDDVDPGKKYEYTADGGISVTYALTGETTESHGGTMQCGGIDEEKWLSLFPDGLAPDISGYEQCIEAQVTDSYTFYLMDEEIWLGVYNNGELSCLFKTARV